MAKGTCNIATANDEHLKTLPVNRKWILQNVYYTRIEYVQCSQGCMNGSESESNDESGYMK